MTAIAFSNPHIQSHINYIIVFPSHIEVDLPQPKAKCRGDQLPVVRLIEHLKSTPTRLAIVADDHGNIEGVVTPTDVLAAIAGDLVEEEDAIPKPIRLPDGSVQLDGVVPIDELAEFLNCASLAGVGSYTTLAGFVLWKFGHTPEINESFEWEGWRFVVAALEGSRIEVVIAQPRPMAAPGYGRAGDA